jgi:hypothetical protein|tara:strand:- start:4310 stop:4414 length:105 start_codon:yes stop_codon:yes gene_type:complete
VGNQKVAAVAVITAAIVKNGSVYLKKGDPNGNPE